MKFAAPTGWILWFSCFAPAVVSLSIDAFLRFLEKQGKVDGGELGMAPIAGLLTLSLCIAGSLPPAIWLNKKESLVVSLVYWGLLAVVNIGVTVPGCSFIWG